jgi:hypothetical protein
MPKVHVTLMKKETKKQSELLSKVVLAKRKKKYKGFFILIKI